MVNMCRALSRMPGVPLFSAPRLSLPGVALDPVPRGVNPFASAWADAALWQHSAAAHLVGFLNVRGLLALRALHDLELHPLAFLQRLETGHLNCRKVRKQFFLAVIRLDKAETLGVIEPFDDTASHKLPQRKS